MQKKQKITWLWLEDQPSTIQDLKSDLENIGTQCRLFATQQELTNFLIEEKMMNRLNQYGLIIDVLLMGANYIICPKEWSGRDIIYYPTKRGYDAGIVYFEKIIMNGELNGGVSLWNPPPPTIFLTVVNSRSENNIPRLSNIKLEWGRIHNIDTNRVKVEWIDKWAAVKGSLIDTIKRFEEMP